jgi:predicted acylesterase/phospholipase RssA/CRP-like cAMP-binding protein
MYLIPTKERTLEFLKASPLFRGLESKALEALIDDFEIVHLEGQRTLIREGELENDLYLVLHGRLRSFLNADTLQEKVLSEIGAGEVFGEIAILVDKPRTATVKTIRDSVLLKLSKKNYDKFIGIYPQSGIEIAKACIKRLLSVSTRGKVSKNVNTVTFMPLADLSIARDLIHGVAQKLEKSNKVVVLTRKRAEELVGDTQNIFNEPEKFEKLLRFLNEQEYAFRYVLYEADGTWTPWTQLCFRQADNVYVIKDGSQTSISPEVEQEILNQKSVASVVALVVNHKNARLSVAYDWIRQNKISSHFPIDVSKSSDLERIVRLINGTSVGLVLSGGGARGLAHVGVLRALEQANIPIDIIGGTSSGSIVAAAYAMGLNSHDVERLFKEFIEAGSRLDLTFPYISLTSGKRLVRSLMTVFGDKLFEELRTRMFCVSTNLTKNELFIHDTGPVWKGIRASVSLPGIYPPVFTNGELLVDGGVLNNLPVEIMNEKFKAGKTLASMVLLSGEKYRSTIESESLSGWKVLFHKLNPFASRMYIPRIDSVLMRTMNLNEMGHQLAQAKQADFSFMLNLDQFGLMDFKRHKEIVDIGFAQASEQLAKIDLGKM